MQVRFTRSARKHRIGVSRALAAMEDAGDPTRVPASQEGLSDQLLWIGVDNLGIELEIVAVERPDALLVIHVMPTHFRRRRE